MLSGAEKAIFTCIRRCPGKKKKLRHPGCRSFFSNYLMSTVDALKVFEVT